MRLDARAALACTGLQQRPAELGKQASQLPAGLAYPAQAPQPTLAINPSVRGMAQRPCLQNTTRLDTAPRGQTNYRPTGAFYADHHWMLAASAASIDQGALQQCATQAQADA
jgi:hypothetical protein